MNSFLFRSSGVYNTEVRDRWTWTTSSLDLNAILSGIYIAEIFFFEVQQNL